MRSGVGLVLTLTAACAALVAQPAAADPIRVWGTCSAIVPENPSERDRWEYVVDFGWDTTGWELEHLEHVVLFTGLCSCPCIGEPSYFAFPFTSGTGMGTDGVTTRYYYSGHFFHEDFQRLADACSVVVFNYIDTSSELHASGRATLRFFSKARPGDPVSRPDGIAIIAGPYEARGEITGVFPSCDCGNTPVQSGTWGVIKSIFR